MADNSTVIRRSLVDQVYTFIVKKIQYGELKPGDRINIEELAKEFDVSRTPMREAISRLAQNGFVEMRHNAGPRVAVFSIDKVRELCIANAVIMDGMSYLTFDSEGSEPILDHAAGELQSILEHQKETYESGNIDLFYEYSIRFHEVIIQMCPNSVLREYAMNSQIQLDAFVLSYQHDNEMRKISIEDHEKILTHLRAHNRDAFRDALYEHNVRPVNYF